MQVGKALVLAELRQLSINELVDQHDACVKNLGGVTTGVDYYLNEIARRDTDQANERMTKLTQDMHRMTIAIMVMTAITTLATLIAIAR
jgi:hypothetical protein